MDKELFSDLQNDVFPQEASTDIQKISINLRMPCCPEPTPGEKVLLKLKSLGAEADFETGNIKGTDMHFETCRKNIIEEVNKGNIAFLSGGLRANCPEDSECKKCAEAFNVAIGTKQYASEVYVGSDNGII